MRPEKVKLYPQSLKRLFRMRKAQNLFNNGKNNIVIKGNNIERLMSINL